MTVPVGAAGGAPYLTWLCSSVIVIIFLMLVFFRVTIYILRVVAMIENKENGDTETWLDIENCFSSMYDIWIYEYEKDNLTLEKIDYIQELFSECFHILRNTEEDGAYVRIIQRMELLRLAFFGSSSLERVTRRALLEIPVRKK